MSSQDKKERRIAHEKRRKTESERRQSGNFAWLGMMERREEEDARRAGTKDRRKDCCNKEK